MTEDALWRVIYQAFAAHRRPGEPDSQTALNRIAAKCIAKRQDTPVTESFDPPNCRAREETLSVEELGLLETYHGRANPVWNVEPIIVLGYHDRRIVIDGNTRVNKWRAEGGSRARRAIVIEPKETASAGGCP
jgi:hypothetical protein